MNRYTIAHHAGTALLNSTIPASAKKARLPRWIAALTILALALPGIGWFATRAAALVALDRWVEAQQRIFGRKWSCASQRTSGFPFRVDFVCDGLKVEVANGRGTQAASASRLEATAPLANPFRIEAKLTGPLDYRTQIEAQPVSLRWTNMSFDIAWGSTGLRGLKVRGEGLEFPAAQSRLGTLALDVVAGAEETVDIAMDAMAFESSPLNQLTGSSMPAALGLKARMDRADVLLLDDLIGSIEDWRITGGKFHLSTLRFEQAAMTAEASGVLQLDDLRRLRGNVSISASNVDEVLKRYGVSPAAVSIGSALSGFLARREPAGNPSQPGMRLTLPVELKDGRAAIGPLRLPLVLLPLY